MRLNDEESVEKGNVSTSSRGLEELYTSWSVALIACHAYLFASESL